MTRMWNLAKASTLMFLCVLFLGIGMKAEAAPGTVTGVKQVDDGTGRVEIAWDAVIGNDIRYKVEWCADKNFVSGVADNLNRNNKGQITWATNSTTYGISSLTQGKKYYVRVTAFTNTGYPDYNCTWGGTSSVLEVVTEPTGGVENLRETKASETSVTIAWNKNTAANAYEVIYQKEGTSVKKTVKLGNVNSFTAKKLSKNSEYQFWVYPVNQSASGYRAISSSRGWIYSVPVLPTKVSGLSCQFWSPTSNYLDLEFSKRNSADGYQYQIYTEKGKKALINGKTTSNANSPYFFNNKLKGYRFLKLKVRAYINVNGSAKYGAWSDWVYFSRQPKVDLKSTKSGMKLSWDKISGATNYTVYVSTKKDSGYKKVGNVKKTSATVKKYGKSKLKSGKQYYFIVVANKKVGKKTFHSTKNYCYYMTYRK